MKVWLVIALLLAGTTVPGHGDPISDNEEFSRQRLQGMAFPETYNGTRLLPAPGGGQVWQGGWPYYDGKGAYPEPAPAAVGGIPSGQLVPCALSIQACRNQCEEEERGIECYQACHSCDPAAAGMELVPGDQTLPEAYVIDFEDRTRR